MCIELHSDRYTGETYLEKCVSPTPWTKDSQACFSACSFRRCSTLRPDGGATVRGDSHLLIVGDPGMGKSQLLRYAAQVAPRSVLTSGVGSTAAGLTAAAVKCDGSEGWMLDAGALVLADGGICCIDEFDTISTGERAAIHEAMEQQTVSFAKGSIVATLQTRCSVFGATESNGDED